MVVWGHGFGLIAILIEEVGLGSDDGGSFSKLGATSHDQSLFTVSIRRGFQLPISGFLP